MRGKQRAKTLKRSYRKKTGGNNTCSMCEKKNSGSEILIPRECLVKYGHHRAHKICSACWWSEFSKEDSCHKCPGCVKGKPVEPESNKGAVIDLTGE